MVKGIANKGLEILQNRWGCYGSPLYLILFVTLRCNFRCSHCFIENFEEDSSKDLKLDVIKQMAPELTRLRILMITGGEPFLRKDMSSIIEVVQQHAPLEVVSIVTNGFNPDLIRKEVKKILGVLRDNIRLNMSLSIDGLEADHDEIRRVKGSFSRAIETAKQLMELAREYKNLRVSANITVLPNQEEKGKEVAKWLVDARIFHHLSHNIFRGNDPFSVTQTVDLRAYLEISHLLHQYNESQVSPGSSLVERWLRIKNWYQSLHISRLSQTDRFAGVACEAGRQIGVVYANGDVAPCELLPPDWGNINSRPFGEIWNAKYSRDEAKRLRSEKCYCTHECFIGASLNTRPAAILQALIGFFRFPPTSLQFLDSFSIPSLPSKKIPER
jgi:MoaA/NifB/PqqE/SkfB family radical SAM enzyme